VDDRKGLVERYPDKQVVQGVPDFADTRRQNLIPVLQVGQARVEFKKTVLTEKTLHLDPSEMRPRTGNFWQGEWHGRSERKQIS
jgi:hypothetical protein